MYLADTISGLVCLTKSCLTRPACQSAVSRFVSTWLLFSYVLCIDIYEKEGCDGRWQACRNLFSYERFSLPPRMKMLQLFFMGGVLAR